MEEIRVGQLLNEKESCGNLQFVMLETKNFIASKIRIWIYSNWKTYVEALTLLTRWLEDSLKEKKLA